MSTQAATHHIKGFQQGIQHLAEQKESRLRMHVRNETLMSGEENFFDQVGSVSATKRTTRHGDTVLTDTPQYRRKVIPYTYDHADMIDRPDQLRVLNDPTSAFVTAFGRAFGRAIDDEIISAALGTAYTGKAGTTATSHPGGDFQIASGSAGLTLTKLIQANKVLRENENDPEQGFKICVSQEQVEDLLLDSTFTSADYNTIRALMSGTVNSFMGFDWVFSERLGTSSGERQCLVWPKNCLLFGALEEFTVDIGPRRDKNGDTQVHARADFGATRMDETGVIELLCTE